MKSNSHACIVHHPKPCVFYYVAQYNFLANIQVPVCLVQYIGLVFLVQYSWPSILFPIMLGKRARSSMVGPVYLTQYSWSSNSVCIALYAGLSIHSHYFRPIWKFQYARSSIVDSVFQTQYQDAWPSM